jgi:HPt (histidine-containing phosphotransfer) domain-containing protein
MAYDPGAINATLAAAVGDDPLLIADLREMFLESVRRALDTIERAYNPRDWNGATERLKGLAASFGAVRLMAAAEAAGTAPVGDARALQHLRRTLPRRR